MLVEDLAGGDRRAIFVGRIGYDVATSCEDFPFREPRPGISRAPPRIGKTVLQAPKFENREMSSDRLMVEELQRLTIDVIFRREDFAILLDT